MPQPRHAAAASGAHNAAGNLDSAVPQTFTTDTTAPPSAAAPGAAAAIPTPPSAEAPEHAAATAPHVHVRTDVLDMDISLQGGTLQRADLLRYPKVKGGSEPVRLMNQDSEETLYRPEERPYGSGGAHPTQLAIYTAANLDYELGDAKQLQVPLSWTDGHGVTVTKTFTFHRGEYAIGLNYQSTTARARAWQAAIYAQILRYNPPSERSSSSMSTATPFKGRPSTTARSTAS